MKTVVICIHGLIKNNYHDFEEFKKYIDDQNTDYEVYLHYLYQIDKPKTFHYRKMYKNLEKVISNYEKQNYNIILIGYSFSCGLCAKMNKKHKISKIILISPVTKIFNKSGMKVYIKTFFKSLKKKALMINNKERIKKAKRMNTFYLPELLFSCLSTLRHTNRSFKKIKCPTLIYYGDSDEFTKLKYVKKIYDQIKINNIEISIEENSNHVFIMSKKIDKYNYYKKLFNFINETIYIA